ncbi:MAG: hypothetical protein ACI3W5_14165 [Faecousia sp.]
MKLFESIDGLLVGTKYLAWAIGLVGIVGSVILFFANLSMGFASAMVFIAALLLSVAVTLLLLPKKLAKGKLASNKRIVIGSVALALAVAIMGITYFSNGGFPALNLLFV